MFFKTLRFCSGILSPRIVTRTMSSNSTSGLPASSIPIFTTVASYRQWRREVYKEGRSVGFVPTMGALHEGHISLVRRSLAENDYTAVSIFVNPAQFAPTEDLATYPRTLHDDLKVLEATQHLDASASSSLPSPRVTAALFLPSVAEMYPSGIIQEVSEQKGTFVEVKGYSHQMEGSKRPTFFRGVATVVTKLLNAIEPTRAYFGQKDIQQALLLRRMVRDLLFSHPTPENLFIVPTQRDPTTSLALSSRNTYLTPSEKLLAAPKLYAALQQVQASWESGLTKDDCVELGFGLVDHVKKELDEKGEKIEMKLDYIELNDPETFEVLEGNVTREKYEEGGVGRPVVLSGAMWVGRTRLIDNLILGDSSRLGVRDVAS